MRFICLILVATLLLLASPPVAHANPLRVVFLDPGFAKSPLQLKTKLDDYLKQELTALGLDAPTSQPVDRTEAFIEYIKAKDPQVIIASGQYLKKFHLDKTYTQKLSLVCRQSGDYRLLLLSRKDTTPRSQPLLASSYSADFLRDLFSQETQKVLSSSRMIQTKKDMDGLMALVNSQVDWAVTSDFVFSLLIEANPAYQGQVTVHKNSKKLAYPSLFVKENVFNSKDLETLVNAFRRMSNHKGGQELLELLGCESWK